MQTIYEKTKGSWRPGPGTIYPLLRKLAKEGLTKPAELIKKKKQRVSQAYALTDRGKRVLEEMKLNLIGQDTEGQAMVRVLSELLPVSFLISFYLKHIPVEWEFFVDKVMQLPPSEREAAIKEMERLIERQLSWVKSMRSPRHRE